MKKNKITKIGTISAMGLLLLVGGVYATWTYASGSAASTTGTNAIKLTGVTTSGEKGVIAYSTDVQFQLDECQEHQYHGVLSTYGSLTITFTPSDKAEQSIKDYGIDVKVAWSQTYEAYQFANLSEAKTWIEVGTVDGVSSADANIADVTRADDANLSFVIPANTSTSSTWTKSDKGVFSYTISTDLFAKIFVLSTNDDGTSVVYLPTIADYNSFYSAISSKTSGGFTFTASDTSTSTTPVATSSAANS